MLYKLPSSGLLVILIISDVDPHHFDADPDVDPDSICHTVADPDSAFHLILLLIRNRI
jgi:hypothetical protein